MKKQILAIIMAIIFILQCCPAVLGDDDEFTLRNGIRFGDTIDDIVEKEKTLTRESETSNSFKGTIAGISDSSASFAFDEEGKLKSMNYFFDDFTSRDSTNDNYKTLYNSLIRQYGSAKGNTGGTVELITGPAITSMGMWVYLLGSFDGCAGDYIDYDEWIVDTVGGHVKIDLVSYYYRDKSYNYTFRINLSYLFYTDADYNAALAEKMGEREAVDNDL